MTYTKKYLKLIIPFIIFVTIGIYGMYSVKYISVSQAMKTTFMWCVVPTIILAIYYAYHSSFGNKKETTFVWKKTLAFIVMTIIFSIVIFISFQGILMIINSKVGNQKEYLLYGKITKLNYPKEKKIGNKYSIEIERKLEKDTIELNVPTNKYQKNQIFEKIMKVGSLHFIYLEE